MRITTWSDVEQKLASLEKSDFEIGTKYNGLEPRPITVLRRKSTGQVSASTAKAAMQRLSANSPR